MRPPNPAYPVSHWLAERHPYPAEPLPDRAEIVVLGGGLVGVGIALALAEAGHAPWVVEREHLAAGASGRNGGLLLPGTAELYPRLVARWGRARARALWGLAEDGARALVDWIDGYAIDCGWRAEGGLHVATTPDQAVHLRQMAALLGEDGFGVRWLEGSALSEWLAEGAGWPVPEAFHGGVLHPGGGGLHSGKLVTGLAAAAAGCGAHFAEGCVVQGLRATPGSVVVELVQDGRARTLETGIVVIAANAWAGALLPALGSVITPVRGQVCCTRPTSARTFRGAWSLNDGFEYFQQLPDGRLVLGGMRWAAPDLEVGHSLPETNEDLQARLVHWFGATFPGFGRLTVERRWAGIMAFTPDRLPLIGPADDGGRVWLAAGFNGHGLPFAALAGARVAAGLGGGAESRGEAWSVMDPRRWLPA